LNFRDIHIYRAATIAAPPKRAAAHIVPVWYAAPPVEVETLVRVAPELSVIVMVMGVTALELANEAALLRKEEREDMQEEASMRADKVEKLVLTVRELAWDVSDITTELRGEAMMTRIRLQ
jgi:hypothetical protein